MKKQKGITLVALVVTIVILVILAVVSIYAVLGENGLIQKTQEAKGVYEQAKTNEEAGLGTVEEYVDERISKPQYNDNTLPSSPKVAKGMTKVKYNSTTGNWERVTDNEAEWYDYGTKQWANVVLGDATFNADGILDESQPYTQLVWIPRYAYKITSMYHRNGYEATAGNIEVVFIDKTNKSKEGTLYSTTYPAATAGGSMADFVVHPAFEYGGQHLVGIWVGKFESSHTGCDTTVGSGQATYTGNEVMTIKANVTSWRNLAVGNMFDTCLNMNREGNPYGLSTNDSVVDPHLMKNDEWGAVAYLSKSSYGKETEKVWNNSNSSYITGMAGSGTNAANETETNSYKTENGVKASTNGNVTGVYDMRGGSREYTAAYVNNGSASLETGGDLTVAGTASKYRNVYTIGISDTDALNYAVSTPANGHYGDAVYETSIGGTTMNGSWYAEFSYFPYLSNSFFERGGEYNFTNGGVFYFRTCHGDANSKCSFHVSLAVL